MASKQASLILKLIDEVSGPARGIAASLGYVDKAINQLATGPTKALRGAGRRARSHAGEVAGLSAGVSLGVTKLAKDVYNLEKQLNISVAAGELDSEQRAALMQEAIDLNAEYAATSAEIVAGANELLKAGLSYEQMMGALRGVLDTAQAMDVPIADASEAIVTALVAQRMEMENVEQTMKSSLKMADLYAHAVAETTGALDDFTTSGKYFNSVAAAIGMSPEESIAWQIALAKGGIMGSSAGTGLRNAPVRIAAPTKKGREALAQLGIDHTKYVGDRTSNATGASIASVLEATGISEDLIDEAAIDRLLNNKALADAPAKLANAIIDTLGDEVVTAADRSDLSDSIQRAIAAGISEVDMIGFLKEMQAKGAGIVEFDAIFGRHHASKMMAIDPDTFDAILLDVITRASGRAKQMRSDMMSGIVLAVNELTASWEAMAVALGDSGLLQDAVALFKQIELAMTGIAETSPELLRWGGYAAIALAAAAPLGWALSGIASTLALMVNPITAVVAGLGYLAYQNWDNLIAFGEGFKLGFLDNIDPNAISQMAGWLDDIKLSLSGEGWAGDGQWWGASVAQEINAFVASIEKLKSEVQALRDWWNGEGESPIQLQTTDSAMGQFWRDLGEKGIGALGDYFLPDAWNPNITTEEYIAKTKAAGEQAKTNLDIVATPIVDSSSIDAAVSKAQALNHSLRAMGGVFGGGSAPAPVNQFGGPRASGGPVRRGLSYLVGEEGPEIFSPGQNGGITPNHALGGASQNHNTFYINGSDPKAIAREVGKVLDRQLERSRQLSLHGRPVRN